jgi:hypothetical protein
VNVANEGEEIRMAAGTYSGAQTVMDSRSGYTYTQVVFIDKSLTLRGGFDPGEWETADPDANRTVIDAQGWGRGISIVGTSGDSPSVTVDGFTITGGDYTNLGNPPGGNSLVCFALERGCGGGLYADRSALILRNSVITNNVAGRGDDGDGGGIYLWRVSGDSASSIENVTVISNSAPEDGGGLYVYDVSSPINVTQSTFRDNHAKNGGGTYVGYVSGPITISRSIFHHNNSSSSGGAMRGYDIEEPTTITRTTFSDNVASAGGAMSFALVGGPMTILETDFVGNLAQTTEGGGAYIDLRSNGDLRMDRVRFLDNWATRDAAALYLKGDYSNPCARLTNVLFGGNGLTSTFDDDAVLHVTSGADDMHISLVHVTAADNEAPTFLYAHTSGGGNETTVTLTNTLVASLDNGFAANQGGGAEIRIRHINTLVDDVTTLHRTLVGTPTFEAVGLLSGEAWLDSSYHLGPRSDAIDAGVDAGVTVDIDGDMRPIHDGFDIGADELTAYLVYLPLLRRDQ